MRKTFIDTLIELARIDKRVFLVTADMGYGVLEPFRDEFPDRFLNTGIAEQNTIGVAAGLALSGYIVYAYSIVPFITMRCYEQIRVDLAYMNTKVRLIGVGAGFEYGSAGATHHAIEDISLMRSLPNMTVCCPGDNLEAKEILEQSILFPGPMYIRIGKNKDAFYQDTNNKITIGKASVIEEGQDIALITTSNMLGTGKKLCEDLKSQGRKPYLVSMHTVKPLDTGIILDLINRGVEIYTLEEHNIINGLGSAVAEVIAESGKAVKFKRIGIPDTFSHYIGNQDYLREKFELNKLPI